MGVHSSASRAGAAAASTALLLCTSLAAADAAGSAQAASANTVTAGSWGAVATNNTIEPYGAGPLVLPVPNVVPNGKPEFRAFFTVASTGTLPISAASYTAAASPSGVTLRIEACSSGWNETADTCAGVRSTVLETPAANLISSTIPREAGTAIRLRVSLVGAAPKNTEPVLTIGVDVSRAQVRAASLTGS